MRALPLLLLATLIASCSGSSTARTATSTGGETSPEAGAGLLDASLAARIDEAASDVLAATGAPSASIAIVQDGRLAYARAYGAANLETNAPATTAMRYGIGSVSKQFTATAVLLLAEDGRLSLEDPIGRYVPGLTGGDRVTIRQVLDHTAGYRDDWPQDYVPASMHQPTSMRAVADAWGAAPLDFEPGAQWQYSNTGYAIAGLLVESVAHEPLVDFLQRRVFAPLGMTHVADQDRDPRVLDPVGYSRFALGPPRVSPSVGTGWMAAAGELAMPPSDLARWNISLMDRSLLHPQSYDALLSATTLTSGTSTSYGLGIGVHGEPGRRVWAHGGEINGFLTDNRVYPDQRAAITVVVNCDFAGASELADRLEAILIPPAASTAPVTSAATASATDPAELTARVRAEYDALREGRVDRDTLTPNGSAYFDDVALADFRSSLGPLGEPTEFVLERQRLRGGLTAEVFRVRHPTRTLRIVRRAEIGGAHRVEQFLVLPTD